MNGRRKEIEKDVKKEENECSEGSKRTEGKYNRS
jgi:hypothetical protein